VSDRSVTTVRIAVRKSVARQKLWPQDRPTIVSSCTRLCAFAGTKACVFKGVGGQNCCKHVVV
jgi:hypothetical protein